MFFQLILISSVILSAIFSNKFLKALGIPTLLFFLVLGMFFSSSGLYKLNFTDFQSVVKLTSIGLSFIIFFGGFCTEWKKAKPVIYRASILSTFGVLFTAILTGMFCFCVLKLNIPESFLIGSVIASTDAASVFSILKSKYLNLKENTAPLLEIESGSNDPMSYVLVVLSIALFQNNSGDFILILFFKQILLGVLIGFFIAKLGLLVFKKTDIITDGNDSLFIIALVFISYAIAEKVNGNPFLATYFLGIILGNSYIDNKEAILNFFDGITKLAQIGIFFVLGLFAIPLKVKEIFQTGILIFLFLTFLARPIAVYLLLKPFKSSNGQIFLTSWAGLRGVASIVFAIIATDSSLNLRYDLFHLVFLISILSIAIQGTLLPSVAKIFDMINYEIDIKKTFMDYKEECVIKLMQITVPFKHFWVGKRIKDIEFPDKGLVIIIKRGNHKILPHKNTKIQSGDKITLSIPSSEED